MTGGVSLLHIARRVIAEHDAGNTSFRIADGFEVVGGNVVEIARGTLRADPKRGECGRVREVA